MGGANIVPTAVCDWHRKMALVYDGLKITFTRMKMALKLGESGNQILILRIFRQKIVFIQVGAGVIQVGSDLIRTYGISLIQSKYIYIIVTRLYRNINKKKMENFSLHPNKF